MVARMLQVRLLRKLPSSRRLKAMADTSARTGFLFVFFSLHAAEELKFNLVAEDLAHNIYQVQVLNQFNAAGECPIANIVYGATCGRHAFKNAIFGLLALEARRNNNKADFEEFAKDLYELTPSSECLLKEINNKLDKFRKEQAEHYIQAGLPVPGEDPQLRPEEVQYILENIIDITMNSGSIIKAQTSGLTCGGKNFSVTWKHQ